MRRSWSWASLTFLVALALVSPTTAQSPSPTPLSGPAAGRDQVVIGTWPEPDTLNMMFSQAPPALTVQGIISAISTSDVQLDQNWKPRPQGAAYLPSLADGTWRVDGERMMLTWKIKPRHWHDGKSVTCADLPTMSLAIAQSVPLHVAQSRPTSEQAGAQPSFPEMLDRINRVNSTLETFTVEQSADVRILWIFPLSLRATWYVARPLHYKLVFHDPPWFVRRLGTVFGSRTSVDELGTKYRATSIRPKDPTHVIAELVATTAAANPPAFTITIDTSRWLIDELVLKFTWGDVRAIFRYGDVEGYLLPTATRLSVSGFVVDADLTFSNYRLNVPLPPGTFGRRPLLLFG